MGDDHRDRATDTERTTIIHTADGGGDGRTVVAVIAMILLLVVLLFFVLGELLRDTTDQLSVPENVGVNVNINGPDVDRPRVDVPAADAPAASQNGNAG